MPHSIKYLTSTEAAAARMVKRKPAYVVHLEVAPYTDAPMTELDADSPEHANTIACHWLVNGTAHSAAIRKVSDDGTLGEPDIRDLMDYEDELAEQTQQNLNRTMSQYGLVG